MQIGFDITPTCIEKKTGIAYYSTNLMSAIYQEINEAKISLYCRFSRYKKVTSGFNPKDKKVMFYQDPIWPFLKNVDLIHGFDGSLPNWRFVKKICTIHDLFIFKELDQKICSERFKAKKMLEIQKSVKAADAIIAVSQTTKNDILELFDYPAEKIFVTYQGVDKIFKPIPSKISEQYLSKYNLPAEYLLYIGGISARKNVKRMIQAYASSKANQHLPFVLAGEMSFGYEEILTLIDELNLKQQIILLGYVAEDDIPHLYNQAKAFIFSTLYEGFGLPILEAMACKTPVIVGNQGASVEISDGHSVTVDPYDTESIANGIDLALNLSEDLLNQGLNYTIDFTWKRCAEQTLDVYQKLLH